MGIEEGEHITFSVDSVAANQIGAHTLVGNGLNPEPASADPAANPISVSEDIEIFGYLGTKTVESSSEDTAKEVATKVNLLTAETGVKAYAKTYAALSVADDTARTYNLKINGFQTGNFVISSTNVGDAVEAVNRISGASGVTAKVESNKVVLFDADGDDITIENTKQGADFVDLVVEKLGEDGDVTNVIGHPVRLGQSGSATNTPATFTQDAGTLANWDGNAHTLTDGTTSLSFTGATTAKALQAAIQGATGYEDFKYDVAVSGTTITYTAREPGVVQTAEEPVLSVHANVTDAGTLTASTPGVAADATRLAGTLKFVSSHAFSVEQKGDGNDVARTTGTSESVLVNFGHSDTTGVSTNTGLQAVAETAMVEVADLYTAYKSWVDTGPAAAGQITVSFNGESQVLTLANTGDTGSTATLGNDLTNADFNTRAVAVLDAAFSSSTVAATTTAGANTEETVSFTQTNTGFFSDLTGTTNALTVTKDLDTTSAGDDVDASVVDVSASERVVGASTADGLSTITFNDGAASIAITVVQSGATPSSTEVSDSFTATELAAALTAKAAADDSMGNHTFTAQTNGDILITYSDVGDKTDLTTASFGFTKTGNSASVTLGAVTDGSITSSKGYFASGAQTAALVDLTQVKINTEAGASDAISVVDAALDKIAQMRADLGAIENRMDHTISNLMNVAEKTADSRSRLEDADFALESARLAKNQVLQQAGTSMLGQANQMTQLVLDLLRG
ncbi:MAG: hypothetical protein CBC94_001595 [Gammaproteobacteria bacterium TMED134]|nr:MAG: hypothetical protein CBC94_001595 [Gammaproteobacteria bacterium TMED134]